MYFVLKKMLICSFPMFRNNYELTVIMKNKQAVTKTAEFQILFRFLSNWLKLWICVISYVFLANQLALCPSIHQSIHVCLVCKNCNIGHYMQTFQPKHFISTMLIGIIDYNHFIVVQVTLTLASKTSWLYFLRHF